MKRKICYILIGIMLLSACSMISFCSSSSHKGNMGEYKGKKSQKIRQNYKVKGYGDAGKSQKR